jgi:hypothetical protein
MVHTVVARDFHSQTSSAARRLAKLVTLEAFIKMHAVQGIKMDPKAYGPPTAYDR